jgi:hypothetical protein
MHNAVALKTGFFSINRDLLIVNNVQALRRTPLSTSRLTTELTWSRLDMVAAMPPSEEAKVTVPWRAASGYQVGSFTSRVWFPFLSFLSKLYSVKEISFSSKLPVYPIELLLIG